MKDDEAKSGKKKDKKAMTSRPEKKRTRTPTNNPIDTTLVATQDNEMLEKIPGLKLYRELLDFERRLDATCQRRAAEIAEVLLDVPSKTTVYTFTATHHVLKSSSQNQKLGIALTIQCLEGPLSFVRSITVKDDRDDAVLGTWENKSPICRRPIESVVIQGEMTQMPNASRVLRIGVLPESVPRFYSVIDPALAHLLHVAENAKVTLSRVMEAVTKVVAPTPDPLKVSLPKECALAAWFPDILCGTEGEKVVELSAILREVTAPSRLKDQEPIYYRYSIEEAGVIRTLGPIEVQVPPVFGSPFESTYQCLRQYQAHTTELQRLDAEAEELHAALTECRERQKLFADFASDAVGCMHRVLADNTRNLHDMGNPSPAVTSSAYFEGPYLNEAVLRYLQGS